jgi:hypothetical protein
MEDNLHILWQEKVTAAIAATILGFTFTIRSIVRKCSGLPPIPASASSG